MDVYVPSKADPDLLVSRQAGNKYHCWSFYLWDGNFTSTETVTYSTKSLSPKTTLIKTASGTG